MTRFHVLLATVIAAGLTSRSEAMPVTVQSQDLVGHCDVLAPLPTIVDELGTTAVFPLDERITAVAAVSQVDACTSSSNPTVLNVLMDITNQTNISFTDLHYVGDPGTGFTNFDGTINGFEAVRIDNVGVNQPLIGEFGGSLPLVFEPERPGGSSSTIGTRAAEAQRTLDRSVYLASQLLTDRPAASWRSPFPSLRRFRYWRYLVSVW